MNAMKVRFAVAPQSASLTGIDLLRFVEALDASDFDGIWLSDLPVAPALDPLLALALAAGRTSRLRLGANVVPLGRNPYRLAKELAQLDQLSGGRLLLSFVTGLGHLGEREALGLDGAGRGAVLEEVLGLVRAWWGGETVTHRSDRWSFTELPSPCRPGPGSARGLAGRPWAPGARSCRPSRRRLAGSSAHPRRVRRRAAAHPGGRRSCRPTARS